jgi:hypothetical protein
MFKPPQLRERQKRNLRHWGMELFVVVLGVLLALWAQEMVQARNQIKQHRQVMEYFHREILVAQAFAAHGVMIETCLADQFKTLRDLLERDEPVWPGLAFPASTVLGHWMAGPIMFPTYRYSTTSYDRAREAGALEVYPDKKESAYEDIQYVFGALAEASRGMSEAQSALRPLATRRSIDASTRTEMLQHLARFDDFRVMHYWQVRLLAERSAEVGMQADTESVKELPVPDIGQLRQYFGDCVKEFDWSTGKAVTD